MDDLFDDQHLERSGTQVLLYGGINAKHAFDGVVQLQTKFASELTSMAEELAHMSASSVTSDGSSSRGRSTDLMKLQLHDLLLRRNMEELHMKAASKAAAAEESLEQVRARFSIKLSLDGLESRLRSAGAS